jgi:hypothetical protein
MNPTTNNLDPKLKEVYEKVMGTSFDPDVQQQKESQKATVATQPILQTQPISQVPLASVFQPQTPPRVAEPPAFAPSNIQQATQPVNPTEVFKPLAAQNNQTATLNTSAVKKRGISPVILVLGGITFFVLYTVIWAKVFGLI